MSKSIKDIGWNPFLVGGAGGLGTYALTRLLGGNKWLAAALGLGVGTGAGWLQHKHNDRRRPEDDELSNLRQERIDTRSRVDELARQVGIDSYGRRSNISSRELLSDIEDRLLGGEVYSSNRDRLSKDDIGILKSRLGYKPHILKKVLDRDRALNKLRRPGRKLFLLRDDTVNDLKTTESYDRESPAKSFSRMLMELAKNNAPEQ